MQAITHQLEQLRGMEPAALGPALQDLLSDPRAQASAAEYARDLATRDVDWSLRLAGGLLEILPPESGAAVRALTAQARALAYRGTPREALATLELARERALRGPWTYELANVLLAFVQPLCHLGRFSEAASSALAARDEFLRSNHRTEAAMAEVNLGGVLRRMNQPEQALAHYDRARPALSGDAVARAMIDSNRAEALLDLDRYAAARRAFDAALEAFDGAGNLHAAAVVEGNIADLHGRQGHPDLALRHFEAARRRFEAIGAAVEGERARLRIEEADCLARLGSWRGSLHRLHDAFPTLDRLGLVMEAARCRLVEGQVLARLGRFAEAQHALVDAARRFEELGNPAGAADAEAAQGAILMQEGDLAGAICVLEGALARCSEALSRAALISCTLAECKLAAGRGDEAAGHLARAADVAGRIQLRPLLIRVEHVTGLLKRSAGDTSGALASFARAADLLERMHAALPADRYRYAFLAETQDIYAQLCTTGLDRGDPQSVAVAFEALERSASRSLLDMLSDAAAARNAGSAAGDAALMDEMAVCQDAISAAYSRIGLGAARAAQREELPQIALRLAELEAQHDELEARVLARATGVHASVRPLRLDEVQSQLGPGIAVVHYFRDGARYGALVIRHDRVRLHRGLCEVSAVHAEERRVSFQVHQAQVRASAGLPLRETRDSWHRPLGALRAALLDPLRDDLHGAETIGLVAVQALQALPLGAVCLTDASSAAPTYTVLPSATIGLLLAKDSHTRRATPRVLAVGIDDEVAQNMDLEADEVASQYSDAQRLLGKDATVERFTAACADADIIHLSAHSLFADANPLSSRIGFADRWLSAREIARLRLRQPIIVLAGCETGRSEVDTGVERLGLVRAFLAAGAATVVASHWPLHDMIARRLFTRFHAQLAASGGDSCAAYLRAAQRGFAEGDTHPAFWSGLYVVGGIR